MDLPNPQTVTIIREGEPSGRRPHIPTANAGPAAAGPSDRVTNGKTKKKGKNAGKSGRRAKMSQPSKRNKSKHKAVHLEETSDSTSDEDSDASHSSPSSIDDDEPTRPPAHKRRFKKREKLQGPYIEKSNSSRRRRRRSISSESVNSDFSESSVASSDTDKYNDGRTDRTLDLDATHKLLGQLRELGDAIQTRQAAPAPPLVAYPPVQPRVVPGGEAIPAMELMTGLVHLLQRAVPLNPHLPPPPPGFGQGPPLRVHPPPRANVIRPDLPDFPEFSGSGRGRILRSPSRQSIERSAGGAVNHRGQSSKTYAYKRVDQVWDSARHQYRLEDTAQSSSETKYAGYCFHVRRTFDWEGKYKSTTVDIKNKILRDCLQDILGEIKGVSLVEETPKIDPNILFLYLEDMRQHAKKLKKQAVNPSGADKQNRKKEAKRLGEKRKLLKVMIEYIDKEYESTKKSLYPLLEHGLVTFDLLWALWKPGTIAYASTYGSHEYPRALKIEGAEKRHHLTKPPSYFVYGAQLDYDGKSFGTSHLMIEIDDFQGTKEITSLASYPLEFNPKKDSLRLDLIERGKKFVALGGVHYRFHRGMAYYKKKKGIGRVNVNGRIMVDSALHRRINANYPVSSIEPRADAPRIDIDELVAGMDDEDDVMSSAESVYRSSGGAPSQEERGESKHITKFIKTDSGVRIFQALKEEIAETDGQTFAVEEGESNSDKTPGKAEPDDDKTEQTAKPPTFTDEEYLIASPVVLGFSFGIKLWLEFPVSGIEDITWNDGAYDSLVLKPETKEVVKSLVESHKYHATESIDDVIQGKGKGLVAVLHGPPGTGKTLTAEGISELLKCPLYTVSAGELGIDSRTLETQLQQILDICHSWGAILLLDEADVFLEARNMRDIQRNALVSIFLRLLEYFQGILFLTTNRVETFDDAFQSRIHIALRYDPLDLRAKKTVFKMFVDKARAQQKSGEDRILFTDEDYSDLARYNLNGRQIKNTVIRAQALAVNKAEPLAMKHVRQILDVQVSFERDLKGGTGYQDAMRSYY